MLLPRCRNTTLCYITISLTHRHDGEVKLRPTLWIRKVRCENELRPNFDVKYRDIGIGVGIFRDHFC